MSRQRMLIKEHAEMLTLFSAVLLNNILAFLVHIKA